MTSSASRTKGKRSLGRKDGVAVGVIVLVAAAASVGVVVAASVEERAGVAVGGSGVAFGLDAPADCTDVSVAYGV